LGRGELGRDGGMWGVEFGVAEGGGVVGWVMPWRCTYGIWMDCIDVYLLRVVYVVDQPAVLAIAGNRNA
jgi:hypothetical protein